MQIDINQKKITIGDKYRIFTNGEESHYASLKLFKLLAEISLFPLENEEATLTIKKNLTFLHSSYNINLWDGDVINFVAKNIWHTYFECVVEDDVYEIYKHNKRRVSVFKNNTQIAYWHKEAFAMFEGDNYRIYANDDSEFELVIAFNLIIDNIAKKSGDSSIVNYDLGINWFQKRKFDENWKPEIIRSNR